MKDVREDCSPYVLMTIGYEGSKIEDFVSRLIEAGVRTLVDVRELPLSRKKGFSKSALKRAVEEVGIDYVHIRSLGDPKEGRTAARSGDHQRFVEVFSAHMQTDVAQSGLDQLQEIATSSTSCLLCFERNHECCHRHLVVHELSKHVHLKVHHLRP